MIQPVMALGNQEAAATNEITIRVGSLPGPSSVSMSPYILQPSRLGKSTTLEIQVFSNPNLAISQLLSKEIDAAVIPANLAAVLHHRDANIQIAGITGTGMLYLLALGDALPDNSSIEDLRGKRIHTIARGATPDVLLRALAAEAGLNPDQDFEIIYSSDQTELARNLIAGRTEIALMPEPFVSRVLESNPSLRIKGNLQELYSNYSNQQTYPMTALVIRSDFAAQHCNAIQNWLSDMPAAQQWLRNNLEEAAEAAAPAVGIPTATIINSFERMNTGWTPAQEAEQSFRRFIQFFLSINPAAVGGEQPDNSIMLNLSCFPAEE